jgi:DNA-binding response OmpR family regulator
MRILLIEDSIRLQQTVGTALRRSRYAVDVSGDGEDGLWRAENNEYDVIVLDIMLPKRDGLSLLQQLRASGKTTHVLVLTARDAVEDRVRGLRCWVTRCEKGGHSISR